MDWTSAAFLAASVLMIDLAVRLVFLPVILRVFETKPPLQADSRPPEPSAELVAIPTTHGLMLRGSIHYRLTPAPRGVLVFCPELYGNHGTARSYCQGLREAGFDVLSFDFRNQGESDSLPGYEPLHWLTEFEVADVLSVIAFARRHPRLQSLPLGLFGVSRGGNAALVAAARSPDVVCVACDGAFGTELMMEHYTRRWSTLYVPAWVVRVVPHWHIRLTLQMARWWSQLRRKCRYASVERSLAALRKTPVYLICGERDNYVDPVIARQMARRLGPACVELWIAPEAKHNQARELHTQEYDRRLAEFFSRLEALVPEIPAGRLQLATEHARRTRA